MGQVGSTVVFIACRFPFADLRPFLVDEPSSAIALPGSWEETGTPKSGSAQPPAPFVRSFGPIRSRRKGPVATWPRERCFAIGEKVVRFPPNVTGLFSHTSGGIVSRVNIGRRLFSGSPEGDLYYYDILASFRLDRTEDSDDILHAAMEILAQFLTFDVKIAGDESETPVPLMDAGSAIAARFGEATAPLRAGYLDHKNWVHAGSPGVVIEYEPNPGTVAAVGQNFRDAEDIHWGGYSIHGRRFVVPNRRSYIWAIDRVSQPARELRVHLLRLHAEREALRMIVESLRSGRLPSDSYLGAQRLQSALDRMESNLRGRLRFGYDNEKLLRAAYYSDEIVSDYARRVALDSLMSIRPTLKTKVAALLEQERRLGYSHDRIIVQASGPSTIQIAERIVNDDSVINIENSAIRDSVIGNRNRISDSIKRIEESSADRRLTELLEELQSNAEVVAAQLEDPGSVRELLDDVSSVAEEVGRSDVSGSRLERLRERIRSLASTVTAGSGLISALEALMTHLRSL